MRSSALLLFLVIFLSSAFGPGAEAHEIPAGAEISADPLLGWANTASDDGPGHPCRDIDCCLICLTAGLPGPGAMPGDVHFTVTSCARLDEVLSDGLAHAPPSPPPISA